MVFPEGTQKILVGAVDPHSLVVRVTPDLCRQLSYSPLYLYFILSPGSHAYSAEGYCLPYADPARAISGRGIFLRFLLTQAS